MARRVSAHEPRHTEVHGGHAIGFGDDTHFMTVAGSRAGKGRSVIVPTLLTYTGPVLASDPKAELANITAAARAAQGHRVLAVDPFGITRGRARRYRARFNPMVILRPGSRTLIEDAGLIGDAIVVPGNTQDPHWDESSRQFIEGVTLFVATDELFEGRRNLATVRDLIAGQATSGGVTGMDVLAEQMRRNNAADPVVRQAVIDAAEDFFSKPDDERGSVLSNTRRRGKLEQREEKRVGHALGYAYRDAWEVWCEAGVDVDLIVAVAGEEDARAIVRHLSEENLFVTRDAGHETYDRRRTAPA